MRNNRLTVRLITRIIDGDVEPESTLRTERQLAVDLGSNRCSVRESVAELIAYGLLRIMPGVGTRVLDWRREGVFELMGAVLVLGARKGRGPELMSQLLSLRRMIYPPLVQELRLDERGLRAIRMAILNIRYGNHIGRHWRDTETMLRSEEEVLCTVACRATACR